VCCTTCNIAAYATSTLGQFLAWLWPLTAAPAAAQRSTAQQVLSILAREVLAAAAVDGGGGGGTAVAAAAGMNEVEGQGQWAACIG
jgi:hypothetical protein